MVSLHLVVFDDFLNFRGFKEGTLLGFQNFLETSLAPRGFEVLAAPWYIMFERQMPMDYKGWEQGRRYDNERSVAFRIL